MKRKCGLMMAWIHSHEVLLLDEPVSGLDAEFQDEFWQILNALKSKRSIIVVTHDINQAAAERCVVLHEGKVLQILSMSELKAKCGYYYRLQVRSRNNNLHFLKRNAPNIQNQSSEYLTLETCSNFIEYRILMSDFTRLRDVMAHHEQDDLIVATVTLEEEIMAIVKSAGGEALTPKAWDIILRENL